MATFNTFANILPDPAHPITDAGYISSTGVAGPGFSALNFQSVTDTQVSRTRSGRGVQRDGGSQHWEFTISYNPMFRYQFDPINAFLLGRNPRLNPFYVVLPQYSRPSDPTIAGLLRANGGYGVINRNYAAGDKQIAISFPQITGGISGKLKPGDFLNISDPFDFNHQKAYMITTVETNVEYQAGTVAPPPNSFRVGLSPPLQRNVTAESKVVLIDPLFRVITKSGAQEYSLNNDNLYNFSLSLEEIQP